MTIAGFLKRAIRNCAACRHWRRVHAFGHCVAPIASKPYWMTPPHPLAATGSTDPVLTHLSHGAGCAAFQERTAS
ncbi:MAG: hypothetical protein AB7O04_15905 [Hyphomonadaceae bacterium]